MSTTQAPSRAAPAQQKNSGGTPRVDLSGLYDVHISVGLIDERVRLKRVDHARLLQRYIAGREDVLLLLSRENSDTTIFLAANETVRLFTCPATAEAKVPLATLKTLEEIRMEMIQAEMTGQKRGTGP